MLTDQQLDVFRELASIGAGHAATAMSQLVDRRVVITCPELRLIPTDEVSYSLGGPETLVAAIYVRVLGDARGALVFVLDHDSACSLAGMLKGGPPVKALSDPDHELLKQAGHMLLSAFINALSRTAQIAMVPSAPAYSHDMFGGILQTVVAETEGYADETVLIDADFLEDEEHSITGRLFFMPEPGSMDTVTHAMGVDA
jgi:chemotaxis protein CheC